MQSLTLNSEIKNIQWKIIFLDLLQKISTMGLAGWIAILDWIVQNYFKPECKIRTILNKAFFYHRQIAFFYHNYLCSQASVKFSYLNTTHINCYYTKTMKLFKPFKFYKQPKLNKKNFEICMQHVRHLNLVYIKVSSS